MFIMFDVINSSFSFFAYDVKLSVYIPFIHVLLATVVELHVTFWRLFLGNGFQKI